MSYSEFVVSNFVEIASTSGEEITIPSTQEEITIPSSPEEVRSSSSNEDEPNGWLRRGQVKDDNAVKFKKKILAALQRAKGFSRFSVSGELEGAPLLIIDIENVGPMHFPLYEHQAKDVISRFEQSPFGKRSETLINTTVRKSKQLDPHHFKILNSKWENYMEKEIINVIAKEMSIKTPFKASLYKMLLYEPGSFFKPHRDTEKEDGMFGTLVIQLPSKYAGGELLVEHENTIKRFNFSSIDHPVPEREFNMFFAAFYCDCKHEVLPVTKGYRVCLVYNLVSTHVSSVPFILSTGIIESQFLNLVNKWVQGRPSKVVYAFSHKYTQNALSFLNLKGEDRSVATFLKHISEKFPLKLYLALLSKHVSGGADGNKYDYELIDPETSYSLNHTRSLNDNNDLGTLEINFCNEVIPSGCFKGMDPDEEEFEDHTGNTGATADKWYHGGAIVFWPDEHTPQVLDAANVSASLIAELFLEAHKHFVTQSEQNKGLPEVIKWLHILLDKIKHGMLDFSLTEKVLLSVISLEDIDLLLLLMDKLNLLKLTDYSPLLQQCEKYGWNLLGPAVCDLLGKCTSRHEGITKLLLFLPEEEVINEEKKEIMLQCLKKILAIQAKPVSYGWYVPRMPSVKPQDEKAFYFEVFQAAKKLDFNMSEYVKSKTLLVAQILLDLHNIPRFSSHSVWRNSALLCAELLNKIANGPVPPINWSRNESWSCDCGDCMVLKEFLRSTRMQETFKISKPRRYHLHQRMNNMLDLTHETMRVGSPQTLVVTKTTGAQERMSEAKTQALSLLPKLRQAIDDARAVDYEVPCKVIKL